jgi:4-hydroxybenzoate polyprenyltransferase
LPTIEPGAEPHSGLARWWVYQRERFPVVAHGLLIAAFSSSAVSYSAMLRGSRSFPSWQPLVGAFVSSFLFFLLLRICDEFKDAEDDARYRPYRPVPRGLVTLRELGVLAVLCGVVQAALAIWLLPGLLPLLILVWCWLGLMSREFFISNWLRKHPVHYLWTHMLVLPVIDFYVSAWDWAPSGHPQGALAWLLGVSFFNGVVIEIGRKTRVPIDEEPGVETYSSLWGPGTAVRIWLAAMAVTAVLAAGAAYRIHFLQPIAILAGALIVAALACARSFRGSPVTGRGKLIENMAGIWSLLLYTGVGVIPMIYRAWGGQ